MSSSADEAMLHGFLGAEGVAVAVVDGHTGIVVGWTGGAQQLLGYRAEDVVNRPAAELLVHPYEAGRGGAGAHDPEEWAPRPARSGRDSAASPETDGDPRDALAWMAQLGRREGWTGPLDMRRKDGGIQRVSVEAVPLKDPAGASRWLVLARGRRDADATPEVNKGVIGVLLAHSPVGMAVWDTDLRCVWLNTTADHEKGPLRDRRLGAPMREALRGFDTDSIEAVMRQVLEDGRPEMDHEFRWKSQDGSEERVTSSTVYRLDGVDGAPLGLCTIAIDITKNWARERLALLSSAGKRIGTTLDVMTTAQELADVTVPLLADFVTVDLAESVQLGEEPLGRLAPTSASMPAFHRAGIASTREGAPESVLRRGESIYAPRKSPFTHVLETGDDLFVPVLDTATESWLGEDPKRAERVGTFGMHSMMVIPLRAREAFLGVAVFIRTSNQATFTRDDLVLAKELCLRASLNLDNARRYTRERTAALALQQGLLPRNLVGGKAIELATRYLPSTGRETVGGDWFDVIHLTGERVALVIGDVVGHGIDAAATMGQMRTAVRTLAALDLPPEEVLGRLDGLAVQLSDEKSGSAGFAVPGVGATCVYAVYDPTSRICRAARAGHPPPALLVPGGHVSFLDLPAGAPLGLGAGDYEAVNVEVPEGSVIALFTDGLVKTRTVDIDTGLDRLKSALSRPAEELEALCSRVIDTLVPATTPDDDVALLLARTRV
jgi:PAS domain S-box-containing protein